MDSTEMSTGGERSCLWSSWRSGLLRGCSQPVNHSAPFSVVLSLSMCLLQEIGKDLKVSRSAVSPASSPGQDTAVITKGCAEANT